MTTGTIQQVPIGQPEATLLHSALAYALCGWPVFPCRPGAKAPLTAHGFKDASTELRVICDWWQTFPDANIAMPTGLTFDVLDVDVRIDGSGWPALQRLAGAGLLSGAVGIATTRNGGAHLFFPTGCRQSGALREHRLDYKGAGGYVLLAPSRVKADDGVCGPGFYRWNELDLARDQACPLDWDACVRLLRPVHPSAGNGWNGRNGSSEKRLGLEGLIHTVAKAKEGNRNKALYWAAVRAHSEGHCLDRLRDAALAAGLPAGEVDRTLRSATRARREAAS